MPKKTVFLLLLTCSFVTQAPGSSHAETYFVQPATVKVMSKPSFDADALGTVASGYQFQSVTASGRWLKLNYNGRDGFIYAAQALTTAPVARRSAPSGGQKLSARDRTSATVAVAGIKGLTYEDRSRASALDRADYHSLEKMEAIKFSPKEIKAFQEGGMP